MKGRLYDALAAAILLGSLWSAPIAQAGEAFVYDKQTDSLTHVNSGFVFPFSVGEFEGGEGVKQYDPSGNDVSVPCNFVKDDEFIAVTVYVYAIPAPKPGQDLEAVLQDHFASLKAEIQGTYKGARVTAEGDFVVREKKGRRAAFQLTFPNATSPSTSELYLLLHKNWFVKYRVSYPTSAAASAGARVSQFLNASSSIYDR
jgi:hypothetical protein